MTPKKVLVGSPIRQKPAILAAFLSSLSDLEQITTTVDYLFVDDNLDPQSSKLLADFAEDYGRTTIIRRETAAGESYERNEYTHGWKEEQVWKVAAIKDDMIQYAVRERYDSLFLIDSDLVLHQSVLEQLAKADKPIVSCIYWTKWQPDTMEMPQVWLYDEYKQIPLERRTTLSGEEEFLLLKRFYAQLRLPGLYKVGGLGGCTLISREALAAGVRFAEIQNVSFWGEDRHFCIRAQALGFDLFVDTTYPAYHIYRDADLAGVWKYRKTCIEQGNLPAQAVTKQTMAPEQLYEHACAMLEYGYEEETADYFERFLETGAGTEEQRFKACWHAAASYAALGYTGKEKNLLLRMIELFPRAELYCRLGMISMLEEKWREAIAWFERAIDAAKPADLSDSPDPGAWSWLPHLQLCVCYDRLGQYEYAMHYNEIGLSCNPGHPGMLLNRDYLRGRLAEVQLSSDMLQRLAGTGKDLPFPAEECVSRFFTADDPKEDFFIYELPEAWWSRPYEYAWASQFVEKTDVVLDAASGICHPFKFYLGIMAKKAYACDADPRILSRRDILEDLKTNVSERVYEEFNHSMLHGIKLNHCDMTSLPYEDNTFDRVFCISVLEHVSEEDQLKTLFEFSRVLKDSGLILLTVDYPIVNMNNLMTFMEKAGLKFYGKADLSVPVNAISTTMWGPELKCIRLLLCKAKKREK